MGGGVADHPDLRRLPAEAVSASRSLECVLPEDVWVSVPVGDELTVQSPYELRAEGDTFVVAADGVRCEVRIVPPPRFYRETTRAGTPMWRVGRASGGYLAVNPAANCATGQHGVPCRVCTGTIAAPESGAPISVADVVDTVRAAFAEGAVEFVYLHLGHVEGDGAGIELLEPYVRAIKRHFDTLVAVQVRPPRTNGWIDRTYAMGVDGLSYSVEVHDAALLARHGRSADARARTYEALRHAATIFPSGTVWSDLIVGLEPPASTIAGIDALVELGVLPVSRCCPRPPPAGSATRHRRPPQPWPPSSRTCSPPCARRASTCTGCAI